MRTASELAMVVVVIALLAAGGGALKLYMDSQSMRGMIDAYGATLASLPLPPGPTSQAFVTARERAGAGDYATAQSKLKEGATTLAQTAGTGPGGQGPGLTPEMLKQALKEIPESARRFFEAHTDLLQEATRLRLAAGAGQVDIPPDRLQKLVDEVVAAAGKNDEKGVRAALDKVRKGLRRGRPGRGPMGGMGGGEMGQPGADELRGAIDQARSILARARQAGMDTGRATAVLDEAESLLNRGKAEAAAGKLRELFGMMRQAVAGGRRGGGGRMPRRGMAMRRGGPGPAMPGGMPGGVPGFLPGMVGALLGEMRMESPLLHGILDDLDAAGSTIPETNGGQIREILGRATGRLLRIRKGRDDLEKTLTEQQAQAQTEMRGGGRGGPGQRPGMPPRGPGQPRGPMPGGMPFDPRAAHDLIGRALDEARALSPEDYEAQKEEFIERVVVTLLGRGRPGGPSGPAVASPFPPIEAPKEEPTEAGARDKLETAVRDRLRIIQEPYTKLVGVGVDMTEVGRLIQEARQAVNAGKLTDAAKSTNHATDLVLRLVDMHRAELNKAIGEANPGP